jgi:hypothetical protein
MEWKDPPPTPHPGRKPSAWMEEARELKLNPGRWALIKTYDTSHQARSMVTFINKGKLKAFRPEGSYHATSRQEGDDFNVYAYYSGEEWGGR